MSRSIVYSAWRHRQVAECELQLRQGRVESLRGASELPALKPRNLSEQLGDQTVAIDHQLLERFNIVRQRRRRMHHAAQYRTAATMRRDERAHLASFAH
jgi:hypothetical protein